MFCNNCGKELPDNTKFCTYCGTPFVQNNPINQSTPNQTVSEQPQPQAPNQAFGEQTQYQAPNQAPFEQTQYQAPNQAPFEQPQYQTPNQAPFEQPQYQPQNGAMNFEFAPNPEPKKSKKGLKIFLGIAIPVIVLAAAAVLYFLVFRDMLFPAESFKNAEKDSGITAVAEKLGSISDLEIVKGSYDVSVEIAPQGVSVLKNLANYDISWLKSINASVTSDYKDNKYYCSGSFGINSNEVIDFNFGVDLKNLTATISIPDYFDKPITFDLVTILDEAGVDDAEEICGMLTMLPAVVEALPDSDTIENILIDYVDFILDSFKPVTGKTALTVNGVEQTMTSNTVSLSERDAAELVINVLEKVKNDKQIAKIYGEIADAVTFAFVPTWDEVTKEIDEFITEGKNSMDELSSTQELFKYVDYIADGDVMGRKLNFNGEDIFGYAIAENNGKFGFEMYVYDMVSAEGEGTVKGDAYTGDIQIVANGVEVATVALDSLKCDDDDIEGTFTVSLSSGISELSDEIGKIATQFAVSYTFDNGKISMSVLFGGVDIIKLGVSQKSSTGKAKYPDTENAVEAESVDDIEDWIVTFDYDALLDALEDAGVPVDEILDLFSGNLADAAESAIENILD